MADPLVWGLLPKAQDDPTTIDEAIANAISAHEADPEAHLGSGESLETHRANDVIDHPAQSIVPDKSNSANKFLQLSTSNEADIFTDNATNFYPGLLSRLDSYSPISGTTYAYLLNFQIADMGYVSGDIIFDFMYSWSQNSGNGTTRFSVNFARVELKDGNYRLGYYDGSWHNSSWIPYTSLVAQRWRIIYSEIDNTIYWYLNGVQVYSVVQTPVFETSDYMITVDIVRGTTTNASAYFGGIDIGFSSLQ